MYWRFDQKNALTGLEGEYEEDRFGRWIYQPDIDDPAILSDDEIRYALQHSRQARAEFLTTLPTLTDAEQERLTNIVIENKRESALVCDDQAFTDRLQARNIRSIPVRTVGRRGGKGYGGGS